MSLFSKKRSQHSFRRKYFLMVHMKTFISTRLYCVVFNEIIRMKKQRNMSFGAAFRPILLGAASIVYILSKINTISGVLNYLDRPNQRFSKRPINLYDTIQFAVKYRLKCFIMLHSKNGYFEFIFESTISRINKSNQKFLWNNNRLLLRKNYNRQRRRKTLGANQVGGLPLQHNF